MVVLVARSLTNTLRVRYCPINGNGRYSNMRLLRVRDCPTNVTGLGQHKRATSKVLPGADQGRGTPFSLISTREGVW
jgi:hypothetical protein